MSPHTTVTLPSPVLLVAAPTPRKFPVSPKRLVWAYLESSPRRLNISSSVIAADTNGKINKKPATPF